MKRLELTLIFAGLVILGYLMRQIPYNQAPSVVPFAFLSLLAIRRKTFPCGSSAVFGGLFLVWMLTKDYLALAGMVVTFLGFPIRIEKQPVKLWERVLNVLAAGAIAYISLVSPELSIRVVGILSALMMVSSDRAISTSGLIIASSVLLSLPLARITDMDEKIFVSSAAIVMLYSLYHIRKLLR